MEHKYYIQLTPTQLLELLEWHESHVEKYKRRGVKARYLKFHKECATAQFLKQTYELIHAKEVKPTIPKFS